MTQTPETPRPRHQYEHVDDEPDERPVHTITPSKEYL